MEHFPNLDVLIDLAIKEDLQDNGDVTSEAIFGDDEHSFKLISKDKGILCGIEIFKRVFEKIDDRVIVTNYFHDGSHIGSGDVIADISGNVISILKAERTALNFLSILSGVATRTSVYVKETRGRVTILDTRKTIPGFRMLQKYAVRCGGGNNHRMGLYDMVLIKDNHIDAAGGIGAAVKCIRAKWGGKFKVEVEARDLSEVKEALSCNVDRILLDNMSNDESAEAVRLINKACETEASGNMNLQRIEHVALTGVDFISIGEITNSVRAFDFSLKEKKE